MSLSLDSYRTKLIDKILMAASQEDVKRFIAVALKSLEQHNLNGHIITRFAEKTAAELELFNPMKKHAQQWSNIQMAKILFNRIVNRNEITGRIIDYTDVQTQII